MSLRPKKPKKERGSRVGDIFGMAKARIRKSKRQIVKTKQRALESKLVSTLKKAEQSASGLSYHGVSLLRSMMTASKREVPDDNGVVRDESSSSVAGGGGDKKARQ